MWKYWSARTFLKFYIHVLLTTECSKFEVFEIKTKLRYQQLLSLLKQPKTVTIHAIASRFGRDVERVDDQFHSLNHLMKFCFYKFCKRYVLSLTFNFLCSPLLITSIYIKQLILLFYRIKRLYQQRKRTFTMPLVNHNRIHIVLLYVGALQTIIVNL